MDRFTNEFALPAAADFLSDLLDLAEPPTLPNNEVVTYTDRLEVAMPVELDLTTSDDGRLSLGLSPPTQSTQTSVFPVLHRLALSVGVDKDA